MLTVNADGDRAIVQQLALHVCAELACTNRFAQSLLHQRDETLVERDGNVMAGCTDVAGAIAFGREGMERKLAHDEHLASDVGHRAVHHMVLVVEDAQAQRLAGDPLYVLFGVGGLKAHQDEKAQPDLALQLALDGDAGMRSALYYDSHRISDVSFYFFLISFDFF